MKNFFFVGFFFQVCICNPETALYSSEELEIYKLFFKPYGINFKSDLISKTSIDFSNCTDLREAYEKCSSISSSLPKLQYSLIRCPRGSYNCFHNYTLNLDKNFRASLRKVQTTVGNLCKEQCWKTVQLVTNKCILTGKSAIKESDQKYIRFVNEVLKSLCSQQDGHSCADNFINGLLKNETGSSIQSCDVITSLKKNMCSSQCYKDVGNFYNTLKCCVGSVLNIMDCHRIMPENNSYGVFVKEGKRCNIHKIPPACGGNPQCSLTSPKKPTSPPATNSFEGKQIAGAVIAVFICSVGVAIVGNYFYRRMKRKQAIRFEDYGYSRLKMLEDDFYHDVEDDDDENSGLV